MRMAAENRPMPKPSAVSMAQPDNGRLANTTLFTPTTALSHLSPEL